MLLALHEQLDFESESDILVWAAVNVGFMLMCRASGNTWVKLKTLVGPQKGHLA
jgi:hypothetical protein